MKLYESIFLIVLFVFGTLLWTLPIQQDPLPFGEGDAAWHFGNGDAAAQADKVFWKLPSYIGFWYYNYNPTLGINALEYPPPYHVGYSISQIIGGDRFIPVFILIAISSFLVAFSIYLFLRKLYGVHVAMLVATAMVLSFREIMVYLWGQRPTILAFAFVPIILYSFFKYSSSFYEDKQKLVYLYLTGILVILQFLIHPQGLMVSIATIAIYTLIQSFRKKKFIIHRKNLFHLSLLAVLTVIIAVPFVEIYTGADTGVSGDIEIQGLDRLLHWIDLESREGYPNSLGGPPLSYYDTNRMYFPFYQVFLWLGILYLLIKREDKDILILSWLAALYFLIHLDVIGIMPFSRISRMLMGETVLFYSIMAIGIIGVVKLFSKEGSKILWAVTGVLLVALVVHNGQIAYDTLNNAYQYPLRISSEQYEAAQWMSENLPEDAYYYSVGTLTYPKFRFISMLAQRPGVWQDHNASHPWINITHVFIDSSDHIKLNQQPVVDSILNYENQFVNTASLVYDKNNIKIYDIRGS